MTEVDDQSACRRALAVGEDPERASPRKRRVHRLRFDPRRDNRRAMRGAMGARAVHQPLQRRVRDRPEIRTVDVACTSKVGIETLK